MTYTRKLFIIANPAAGNGRPFRKIHDYARGGKISGWETEILATKGPGHAGVLARELLDRHCDLLAVCGGDGTINEVVSALPASPPFPLAILPGGTANVLCRELGLPLSPAPALDVALKRKIRRVDVGEMKARKNRRFTFAAGIGFDAWAVHKTRSAFKSKTGIAAYAAVAAGSIASYEFPEFTITANGDSYTATSCIVCNARSYGGGLTFCPDADMTDGFLDVMIIEGVRRAGLAGFLLSAWIRPGMTPAWIRRIRTKKLRADGPSTVHIETDGELVGELPAVFSISKLSLPLVVP